MMADYMDWIMKILLFFYFRSYSVETIDMFPDLIKTERCLLLRHCSREVFQTLHDHKVVRGLANHSRFDDLDLTSKSQVCQNDKLQIVLDSCSL